MRTLLQHLVDLVHRIADALPSWRASFVHRMNTLFPGASMPVMEGMRLATRYALTKSTRVMRVVCAYAAVIAADLPAKRAALHRTLSTLFPHASTPVSVLATLAYDTVRTQIVTRSTAAFARVREMTTRTAALRLQLGRKLLTLFLRTSTPVSILASRGLNVLATHATLVAEIGRMLGRSIARKMPIWRATVDHKLNTLFPHASTPVSVAMAIATKIAAQKTSQLGATLRDRMHTATSRLRVHTGNMYAAVMATRQEVLTRHRLAVFAAFIAMGGLGVAHIQSIQANALQILNPPPDAVMENAESGTREYVAHIAGDSGAAPLLIARSVTAQSDIGPVATVAMGTTPAELERNMRKRLQERERKRLLDRRPGVLSTKITEAPHPAAGNIWDTIGMGADGQYLVMHGGLPTWMYPAAQENAEVEREPTRRAGGNRGGGGGGGGSSTTTTTITTTIVNESNGWTDGDGVIYLTTAADKVGIGTETPETELEVVGTISASLLTLTDLANCDTIDTDANGVLSCGSDSGAGTFDAFNLTDGTTTEVMENNDTITFTDGTDIDVVVSATDTVTFNFTNASGFITAGDVSANETDPVYSGNSYAVDMDQNVGTDDSPTFAGLTLSGLVGCDTLDTDGAGTLACGTDAATNFTISDGVTSEQIDDSDTITFTDGTDIDVVVSATDTVTFNFTNASGFITAGDVSANETDPVYSGNSYAVDMDQNVGTDDSPTFSGLRLSGFPSCDTIDTDGSGNLSCGTDDNDGTYFFLTDGATTEQMDYNNTITFTDGTDIDVVVSATDTVTFNFTNASGFITAGDVSANETDPVYSGNSYAVDMDQNVGTDDSPTFAGLTSAVAGNEGTVHLRSADGQNHFFDLVFENNSGYDRALIRGEEQANYNGDLVFLTDGNNSGDDSATEKMRILADGTVRIANLTSCDTIDTDGSGNLSCGTDAGGLDQGGLTVAADYVWWDGTDVQPGSWGDVALSILNNDAGFITAGDVSANETDPVYSANTFAVDMDQNVGTDDSPTFASMALSSSVSNLAPMLYSNGAFAQFPPVQLNIGTANTNNTSDVDIGINLENTTNGDELLSPFLTFSTKSDSASYNPVYAGIAGRYTDQGSNTNWAGGALTFWTASTGSTGPLERMSIHQNGVLQVNTLTGCDTIDTDGSGNLSCGTDAGGFTSFNITDGSVTEAINDSNTLTFTDGTDIDVVVSATDTVTFNFTNASGFITAGDVSANETDPVYSGNSYAVDMNQNVGTDDSPTFAGLTLPGLANCDTIDTNGSGVLSCGTDAGGFTSFNITDGSVTEAINDSNTLTFTDGTDIDVVVSATDTVTFNFTNASGFITAGDVSANETDPVYSGNSYAVDMDQNVGTDDSPTFYGLYSVIGSSNGAVFLQSPNGQNSYTDIVFENASGFDRARIRAEEQANYNGDLVFLTDGNYAGDDTATEKMRLLANGTLRITNLANCDTIDTDGSGNLSCGTDAGGFTSFNITDGSVTEAINDSNTLTFTDGTDIDVVVSATDTVTFNFTNASGFITAGDVSANETDPVYSANTFAVDMDQNVGTDDSPTYVGLTLSDASLANCDTIDTVSGVITCGADAGADLAEAYPTADGSLVAGEVLAFDPERPFFVKRAESGDRLIGVYSTDPWRTLGTGQNFGDARKVPVALVGRIPVKVSNEAGAITIGDALALSSAPGVARRATANEATIGFALEFFDGASGTVEAFVNLKDESREGLAALAGDIGPLTGSGLTLDGEITLASLVVEDTLEVIGPVTVHGLARFLGSVSIAGELSVSGKQAGHATVQLGYESVQVTFPSGFSATPIVTATPSQPVLFAVSETTQTGFIIRLATAATTSVTFSWLALSTDDPGAAETMHAREGEATPFPIDSEGVPVSSDNIWNACIRNMTPMDHSGQPYNCSRYHVDNVWEHPDLMISFTWNNPILLLPEGYTETVTRNAENLTSELHAFLETLQNGGGSSSTAPDVQSSPEEGSSASSAASSSEEATSSASSEPAGDPPTEASSSSAAEESLSASSVAAEEPQQEPEEAIPAE